MDSTPYDLEPYIESYKMKLKQADAQAWQSGMYTLCAVQTAVANVLIGKKSKAKYLDEPFMQSEQVREENGELTEEEIIVQRKKLLATLQLMQANFELNHSDSEEGGQDK